MYKKQYSFLLVSSVQKAKQASVCIFLEEFHPIGLHLWNPAVWTDHLHMLPQSEPKFTSTALVVILGSLAGTGVTFGSHPRPSEVFHSVEWLIFFKNTLHCSHWNWRHSDMALKPFPECAVTGPQWDPFSVMTVHKPTAENCWFSCVELIKTNSQWMNQDALEHFGLLGML